MWLTMSTAPAEQQALMQGMGCIRWAKQVLCRWLPRTAQHARMQGTSSCTGGLAKVAAARAGVQRGARCARPAARLAQAAGSAARCWSPTLTEPHIKPRALPNPVCRAQPGLCSRLLKRRLLCQGPSMHERRARPHPARCGLLCCVLGVPGFSATLHAQARRGGTCGPG